MCLVFRVDNNVPQYPRICENVFMIPDKRMPSLVDTQETGTRSVTTSTVQRSRHHRRRWFVVLGVIVIALLSVSLTAYLHPGVLAYLVPDIAQIADDDLRVPTVSEVPEEQNAYNDLVRLEAMVNIPEEEQEAFVRMVQGGAWDDVVANDILSRNTEVLALYAVAAGKHVFQAPYASAPRRMTWATNMPSLGSWRTAAQLSSLAARSLARQGQASEAFDTALQSVRIGQNIMLSYTNFHSFLVSIALRRVGLDAVRDIAASSSLRSSELSEFAEELSQYSINENALIQTLKVEYTVAANSIAAAALGDESVLNEVSGFVSMDAVPMLVDAYHFQPNKTTLLLAQHWRSLLTEAHGLCDRRISASAGEMATGTRAGMAYLIRPNAFGEYLAYESMFPIQEDRMCIDMAQVAATQAVLALYAYRQDNGQYPNVLADLVPQYLAGVPFDPYDGKEIKYTPIERMVYSSGRDMVSGAQIADVLSFYLR